jgi:predicted transposase/invertase (TIGR01784 family)
MENTEHKHEKWILDVDFSKLMDLRVDYAFKLVFGSGDTSFLISLLNAIFANKKIPRVIKSLTIENPFLEKHTKEDKLSIPDVRAQLDDGTTVLIEMHLYDIDDLKYKTIRSWARTYREEISSGDDYSIQPPVICITFANGSMDENDSQKIHKCCKILDIDDNTIFTDALELHYINMKAFVKFINETGDIGKGETQESMLANWLALITEKDIENKAIIKSICEEQEEIGMVVSELVRMSEDKITRQAYQRRQDEIMLYNNRINTLTHRAETAESALAERDTENELLKQQLAKLRSQLADK